VGLLAAIVGAAMPGAPAAGGAAPELTRRVADDAGSADAPVLFGIGIHVEPQGAVISRLVGPRPAEGARPLPRTLNAPRPMGDRPPPNYNDPPYFRRTVDDLGLLARLVERRGGRLTVQVQTPFTRVAVESKEPVLADLEKRGHEIALHFHEYAHLGQPCDRFGVDLWKAVMQEEIDWIRKSAVKTVRYWSGGNLYPGVLEAAAGVGLAVMSDYKNPHLQQSDARLQTVNPWRPAGGPREGDLAAFAAHDPRGRVVYLPDGIYASADYASLKRGRGGDSDARYFDLLTEGLETSLRAARPDRVNVFHLTVHPGEFRGIPREPYGVVDRWLTQTIDPLVKAGKVRWATFSEMAEAFTKWEQANPGVDPRSAATKAGSGAAPPAAAQVPAAAATAGEKSAPAAAPAAGRVAWSRCCVTMLWAEGSAGGSDPCLARGLRDKHGHATA
jgi:hypothetical protein